MLKGAAKIILTVLGVFVLLPALFFVLIISVQEGCFLCFEGEGRGGMGELITNIALGVTIIGLIVLFVRRRS